MNAPKRTRQSKPRNAASTCANSSREEWNRRHKRSGALLRLQALHQAEGRVVLLDAVIPPLVDAISTAASEILSIPERIRSAGFNPASAALLQSRVRLICAELASAADDSVLTAESAADAMEPSSPTSPPVEAMPGHDLTAQEWDEQGEQAKTILREFHVERGFSDWVEKTWLQDALSRLFTVAATAVRTIPEDLDDLEALALVDGLVEAIAADLVKAPARIVAEALRGAPSHQNPEPLEAGAASAPPVRFSRSVHPRVRVL